MRAPLIRKTARTPAAARRVLAAAMATALAAVLAAVLIARAWPKAPLREFAPGSTAISAGNGELLRLTLAADGQYRLWVSLDDMPKHLPAAVLLSKVRWFYRHPGVNPFALARAAVHDCLG